MFITLIPVMIISRQSWVIGFCVCDPARMIDRLQGFPRDLCSRTCQYPRITVCVKSLVMLWGEVLLTYFYF